MPLARVRGRYDGVRADIHVDLHGVGEVQGGQQPSEGLQSPGRDVAAQTGPGVGRRVSLFVVLLVRLITLMIECRLGARAGGVFGQQAEFTMKVFVWSLF